MLSSDSEHTFSPALGMKVISVCQDYCMYAREYHSSGRASLLQCFIYLAARLSQNASVCISLPPLPLEARARYVDWKPPVFDDGKYINQFEVDSRKKKKKRGIAHRVKSRWVIVCSSGTESGQSLGQLGLGWEIWVCPSSLKWSLF